MSVWVGLDQGAKSRAHAEHLAEAVLGPLLRGASLACTHVASTPFGHYATSVQLPSGLSAEQVGGVLERAERQACAVAIVDNIGERHGGAQAFIRPAREAAARGQARKDGRAFRFQGMDRLTGRLSVAELIERSAIDAVQPLGGVADGQTMVETMNFVRPYVQDGTLVLAMTPLPDGAFQPFEVQQPHDCCADHTQAPAMLEESTAGGAPDLTAHDPQPG